MPKSERQKLKLLYLRDYLRQNTDEEHPASVQELIDHLAGHDIRAERKSIYDDIRSLNEYGVEVLHRRGKNGGYYVSQRDFQLSELKLLVDAVLSSRFLTAKQSMELIRKLAALSSAHEGELLRREVVLAGRVKIREDNILEKVDILHEAIEKNRKVSFRYFDWGVDRQKHFRPKSYLASPYALLWDDENYYLVADSPRHGLTHYRVDKMEELFLSFDPREFTKEAKEFDPARYSSEVFGMFRGERKQVKLRMENSLAGVVVDRFGQDILLIPDGDTHFTFTVNVSLSPNFFGWVAGFGGRAAVLFPKTAVKAYRELCCAALDAIPEE